MSSLKRESVGVRVAFIPNVDGASSADQSLNKVVVAALVALDPSTATKYVAQLLEDEGCHHRQDCDILVSVKSCGFDPSLTTFSKWTRDAIKGRILIV